MAEEYFVIHGGKKLGGEIEVRGAKNAVFPLLAASLLTPEPCVIRNVPLIEDVFRMIEILENLGAEISWIGERGVKIRTTRVDPVRLNYEPVIDLVTKFRGSVLFLGPLLARFGKVKMARPGGCLIGARPIDTHIDAFSQWGAKVDFDGELYDLELQDMDHKDKAVILNEFSVTGTENMLLLSALRPRRTLIKAADADYQVQELVKFLQKMGAKIEFLPDRTIVVEGRERLNGIEHELMYDPIEAGTFILTAAATSSNLTVRNVELDFLELFLKRIKNFGVPYEIEGQEGQPGAVKVFPWKRLYIGKVQSMPYPGMHSDLLSVLGVLATQAEGLTLIHDPLYEGRLKYLEELNRMGANIIFCDPHRAIINGPTPLRGRVLKTVDLRGGAALIIAGLIAEGETVIQNVYQIDRGYERIEERLQKIGADIKRVNSK